MVTGRISFVGAGPGAADLITMRGARRIAEAHIVLWTASLVAPECVQEHVGADTELVDSSRLTHEETLEIYRRVERDRLNAVRVHPGDPSLWGAVQEQHDLCARMAVEVEVVPGVAGFSAAAASIGRELTAPEVAQSLVLTQMEGGTAEMPDGDKVREFAKHGTTMALFLSAARVGQLVEELQAGGYTDDTPVVVAHKVTWPDELVLRTTLGELPRAVKQHKLWRHTLFLVGDRLAGGGTRAYRYQSARSRTDPGADEPSRRQPRIERAAQRSAARSWKSAAQDPPARGTGGVRDSDVAWWAVRDWQQSARGAARVAASKSSARSIDEDQPDLFDPATEPAAETVGPEGPGAAPDAPVQEDPAAAKPVEDDAFGDDASADNASGGDVSGGDAAKSAQSASDRSGSTSASSGGNNGGNGGSTAKTRAKSQKSTGTSKQATGKKGGKSTAKTAASASGAKGDGPGK